MTEIHANKVHQFVLSLQSNTKANDDTASNKSSNATGEVHSGVVCDGCEKEVAGFRYKVN